MYPHRIRLRGPWEWHVGDVSGKITLPGVLDRPGSVTFVRRFGFPGTIDSHERVWLWHPGRATLNGTALASGPCSEVTGLLQMRNELRIVAEGSPGEVALEIRATAYLAEVVWDGAMVRGRVVGSAPGPLDLYILGERATVAEQRITASEAGTEFALEVVGPVERVELVNGAVIWYSMPVRERDPAEGDPHAPFPTASPPEG